VLGSLSRELDALYAEGGRPSIAPEYILRALLLQVFFSIRSERLLVEQIDYNLLFRWFGPAPELRGGAEVFRRSEPAGEEVHVGRALHSRWHADSGMGLAEELSSEGWRRARPRD
jgi:hypothetical protein